MPATIPNRPAGSDVRSVSQLLANFDAITAWINGANVGADNLTAALAKVVGVSQTGAPRRGKSSIAGVENIVSAAYDWAPTPDRVSGVQLPTDGLIFIAYQALWKQNAGNTFNAAIFVGANQLKVGLAGSPPSIQEASCTSSPTNPFYTPLYSQGLGLSSGAVPGNDASEVSTGQLVGLTAGGGLCAIFAAAGTYDIGVKFKISANNGQVKNRHLWVWTADFS